MKTNRRHHPAFPTTLLLALGLAALLSTGCPGAKAPWASEAAPTPTENGTADAAATPSPEALAAEARALEQRQAELAAAEAAALEATERALKEREEAVRLREQQLEKEEALRQEQARIAQRRAEAEARERQLAAKEKELENYEANLAFQEKELRDRETLIDETLEALEVSTEPAGQEPLSDTRAGEQILDTRGDTESAPEASRPVYASLEPGRLLEIEFEETVSSSTHRRGDTFSGRLVQDLTAEDGTLVVPAGTEVIGKVIEATPPKKVGGRASLEVEFTHLVLSPTDTVAISASFVETGADKRGAKKKIAGAAIVGAILGRVLGGDGAEGVLAGAAAGAAAGTIAVTRGEGKDAEIPRGQIVALQLEEIVTVEIEMTGPVSR